MYMPWQKDGLSGNIQFPKGEVVYQHEPHVRVETIFVTHDEKHYILDTNKLIPAPINPFNGYCYRQDGK